MGDENIHEQLHGHEGAVLMQCGHTAQGTTTIDGEVVPACVICYMGHADDKAITPTDERPSLEGRMMTCSYKHGRDGTLHDPPSVPSSWSAAFFRHRPDNDTDEYYCGCWGWD